MGLSVRVVSSGRGYARKNQRAEGLCMPMVLQAFAPSFDLQNCVASME